MMKEEFEKIAGYKVSEKNYHDIIEPMYLATDLKKEEFVKCINKKYFALRSAKTLVKEMKQIAQHIKDTCEHYTDYDARNKLYALIDEYVAVKYSFETSNYLIDEKLNRTCTYVARIELYRRGAKFEPYEIIELF